MSWWWLCIAFLFTLVAMPAVAVGIVCRWAVHEWKSEELDLWKNDEE